MTPEPLPTSFIAPSDALSSPQTLGVGDRASDLVWGTLGRRTDQAQWGNRLRCNVLVAAETRENRGLERYGVMCAMPIEPGYDECAVHRKPSPQLRQSRWRARTRPWVKYPAMRVTDAEIRRLASSPANLEWSC